MKGKTYETTIKGVKYTYWADFMLRGMVARNEETKEEMVIKFSGYFNNDLTARKAIANAFPLIVLENKI